MRFNSRLIWEPVAIAALLATTVGLGFVTFQSMGNGMRMSGLDMFFSLSTLLLFLICLGNNFKVQRIYTTQNWLIDAVNANVGKLRDHGSEKILGSEQVSSDTCIVTDVIGGSTHWPWGNHHTEALGHLEAAASHYWILFDPDDSSTAPTNDMVSDWLQSERKVSKIRALAIASMLRADGLPSGPRR